jgi:hypothetical protein
MSLPLHRFVSPPVDKFSVDEPPLPPPSEKCSLYYYICI